MIAMKKSATRKDDESDRGTDDTKPCDRGWVDLIKQVDGNDSADVLRCRTQHK
jgi:hypothetical protein